MPAWRQWTTHLARRRLRPALPLTLYYDPAETGCRADCASLAHPCPPSPSEDEHRKAPYTSFSRTHQEHCHRHCSSPENKRPTSTPPLPSREPTARMYPLSPKRPPTKPFQYRANPHAPSASACSSRCSASGSGLSNPSRCPVTGCTKPRCAACSACRPSAASAACPPGPSRRALAAKPAP